MFKKITKWDMRTKLDKEIDETLVVINKIKAELDKSNSEELDERIKSVLKDMSSVDSGSVDHLNMAKSVESLHKAKETIETNSKKHSLMVDKYNELCANRTKQKERRDIVKKVVITSTAYLIGLTMAVKHEEFNVITGKAIGFIPKIGS